MIRILLTGDNHINRYSAKMLPQKLEERRGRLRRAFKKTIDYAIEKRAHLFLQVGDLFDTPTPRNIELHFIAMMMNELKSHGIKPFFISGNHDTPKQLTEEGGTLPHQVLDTLGGISLFSSSKRIEVREIKVDGYKVAIGGLSFNPLLTDRDNPLEGLSYYSDADIRIILLHYSISGHFYPSANEPIISLDSIDNIGDIQLFCIGHMHKYASFQVGKKHVVIPGATEKLTFDETETSGFAYIEIDENGVRYVEYIPIEAQPRQVLTLRTTELNAENPTEFILKRLRSESDPDKILRLKLEGLLSRDLFHQIEYKRIYEMGSNSNFFFELDESELYLEDDQMDSDSNSKGARISLLEALLEATDEKLADESEADERELLFECKRVIAQFFESSNR